MFEHCGQRTDAGAMVYCKLTFEPCSGELNMGEIGGFYKIKSEVFKISL